ncbi:MAG: MarR family winged helix-turn-helix transcriptional regulator [Actinomycetota bacterium]
MARTLEVGQGFRGKDGRVAFLLRQAHGAWRVAIERQLSPLGITGPQYSALNVIAQLPGLSGSELARSSMLTQQTTNEILVALMRRRLIARRPRDGNRRILEVRLTAGGRAVIAKARRIVHRLERRMVSSLTAEGQALFREWLVTCARNLAE